MNEKIILHCFEDVNSFIICLDYAQLQQEDGRSGQQWPDGGLLIIQTEDVEVVEKVFFHVIGLVMLNAYILYREWCVERGERPSALKVFW